MSSRSKQEPVFRLDLGYPEIGLFQDDGDEPLATADVTSPSWRDTLQRMALQVHIGATPLEVRLPESELWFGTAPDDGQSDADLADMAASIAANALSRPVTSLAVVIQRDETCDFFQVAAAETQTVSETREFLTACGFDRFDLTGGNGFPAFDSVAPAPVIAADATPGRIARLSALLSALRRNRRLAAATLASAAAAVAMVMAAISINDRPAETESVALLPRSVETAPAPNEVIIPAPEPAAEAPAPTVFTSVSQPGAVIHPGTSTALRFHAPNSNGPTLTLTERPSDLHLVSVSSRSAPQILLDPVQPPSGADAAPAVEPVRVAELVLSRSPRARPANLVVAALPEAEAPAEEEIADESGELADDGPEMAVEETVVILASGPPARPGNLVPAVAVSETIAAAVETAQIEAITSQMAQSAAASLDAGDAGRPVPRHLIVQAAAQPAPKATVFKAQPAAVTRTVAAPAAAVTRAVAKPAAPAPAATRSATERVGLQSRKVSLVGLFGSSEHRRAIVRMPNGRMEKVSTGDRLDGQQVAAIGKDSLRLSGNGRDLVLKMPD